MAKKNIEKANGESNEAASIYEGPERILIIKLGKRVKMSEPISPKTNITTPSL